MRITRAVLMTSLLALVACSAGTDQEATADNSVEFGKSAKFLLNARPVQNQYIVVLEDDAPGAARQDLEAQSKALAHKYGGTIRFIYGSALRGFSVRMPEAQARALSREPSVKYVEQDGVVTIDASQTNPPWGLDRIDQNDLPLNQTYTYNANGTGVNAYILDTGIRMTHVDFGGRAFLGTDTIGDGQNGNDCHGHGTHVAGTVGGSTYGVAKNVKLYAVRVLNCQGSGTWDQVIAGVNWVTQNHVKPAVANMSLGGSVNQALNDAVTNSIAAGVHYAIAAGNSNADACGFSPASTPNAITVGATESNDARASYSNWGTCLDIFAPGSGVLSAWSTSDTATNTISGTSMATPHVAGVVALYLQSNPNASPATVTNALTNNSTPNKVTNPGTGSPNKLLYMGWITGTPGGDTTPPTTNITAPASGATVSGSVTVSANATDNVGVTRVDFYAGSALIGSDTTAPYSVAWNTASGPNGSVSLTSRALDAAGNVGVSAAVNVTVNNPGFATYDSVLKAPKCGTVGIVCDSGNLVDGRANLGPEPNQPNTINNSCADGTSGAYHSDESLDRVRVSTVDGTNFAPGKQVKVDVTVWAWSGFSSDWLDVYYAADASNPSWQLISTVQPTAAGAQTLSVTYTLPAGASVQAVRAAFRYNGAASPCTTGAYDDRDDLAFTVGGGDTTPPTVSITSPTNGSTVSGVINVSANASDNVGVTKVEFILDGTLLATDTTAPYSVALDTNTLANGNHAVAAKAYDAANNSGTSATVTFTVNNNNGGGNAVYDSVLQAPKCGTVGGFCDTGSLVNGRGPVGPELNASNTINASCADGTSGTYHSDESLDRVKVSTLDGSPFAAGKTVKIEVDVWAWSGYSSDYLDLFYAPNANSPTWTFIGTVQPTAAGAQKLTATYTLPAGSLQAVRAQFRYGGSATPCTTGVFDDRDDVIFAVQ